MEVGDAWLRVQRFGGEKDGVFVVERDFGRERGEGEVVDVGGGAVLAPGAIRVLVVGQVHLAGVGVMRKSGYVCLCVCPLRRQ